jgi:hypothetical protein
MDTVWSNAAGPQRIVELTFGKYNLTFKTDQQGRPILLFMGKKDQSTGKIRGERYARRLIPDDAGLVIKDHWDNKGRANTNT